MWHPHHLIYMPVNWVLLQIVSTFCENCDAVVAGQIHSIIWAVVLTLSVYYVIRHLSGRVLVGILVAFMLLTSQNVWMFALQPQAYAPLLGVLSLLFAVLFITHADEISWQWIVLVSTLYSISVLFHQAMVLLSFPLCYYVATTKQQNGIKAAVLVLLLSGVTVLSLYLWAAYYVMGELSISSFYKYITLFAQVMADPKYFNINNFSLNNTAILLKSQLNSFVSPPWKIRNLCFVIFILTLAFLLIWNIYQSFRKDIHYRERITLVLIIVIFWLLTLWGNPYDYGWPSFILLPIFLLTGITIGDFTRSGRDLTAWQKSFLVFVGVLTIGITARNFNERILPMSIDKGPDFHFAESMAEAIPPECVIYETNMHVYYNLGYYFSRKTADFWDYITAAYYGDNDEYKKYFGEPNRSSCVAINIKYLDPAFNVSGKDGYTLPGKWINLISWLFDFSSSNNGKLTWRTFDTISSENNQTYFIIRDKRMPPGTITDFLHSITNKNNGLGGKIERWVETVCSMHTKNHYINKICIERQAWL